VGQSQRVGVIITDLKSVTDRIKSKCEDGLSDMSEKIAGLEKKIGELKPVTINKRDLCSNLDCLSISFFVVAVVVSI
jgi:hypothetical protein